jgi:hypothetical protein
MHTLVLDGQEIGMPTTLYKTYHVLQDCSPYSCSSYNNINTYRPKNQTISSNLHTDSWTISIVLQCSAVCGSQTEHAYSSFGRTRDRYACDFIFMLEVLRFLFKNPRLLFAATMLLACCVHFKSD